MFLLLSQSTKQGLQLSGKRMKFPTLILTFFIIASFSQATPIATKPQANESFKPNQTQLQQQKEGSSCTYTLTIKTSCSSPSYTTDRISISFGDAYGYQVYVPRLDDPSSGTFERCSTDTFEIYGPCTYQICYLYLYRTGYDGWIPDKVTVHGYNSKPVTFYYNTLIPYGVWYGFDYCRGYASSATAVV
ncbi:embryo-specific protein ATS3B-like [Gastrolobium bilobum]|uniref:embryo-specific protein ATS3B-like n=1 Tax=Gastrolobium bilobum TaxID=150636 RepID=UPI002AB09F16|nr:embryo-specific protein ATS3B-like [Gastrolobium bilobum]